MRAIAVAAAFAAAFASAAHAQYEGRWRATSNTAISITGDIALRGDTLIFGNGKRLKLIPAGEREGHWTTLPECRPGALYRLDPPSDPVLLRGNTLCGKPVTYIVLSHRAEHSLSMTAFTGTSTPKGFGADACAVYLYER